MATNLYLITGDEAYEKEEKLKQIENNFGERVRGINEIVLDKDSLSQFENEINTYPFGFSKKLIVVKLDKKTDTSEDGGSDEKIDFLTESTENTLMDLGEEFTVVFYGNIQKKSRLFKLVQKYGECIVCEKQKDYELLSWCSKYFKENDIKIDTANINYFISLCGNEKLILKNEMDKLIDYCYEKKIIIKEDIDELSIRTSDVIIFDLTDSLGSKNTQKALYFLNELLNNKEPIQKIVIMIAKHFKSILVAKIAAEQNKNVMDELSTKSTYAANKYKSQARYFKTAEIVKTLSSLSKLDIDSKMGRIDLKIGLEKIIMEQKAHA